MADRNVNVYEELLQDLAPILIAIGCASLFWCGFLTYRYFKARPSRKERQRRARIAMNARNRVRGVIGMSAVNRAFIMPSAGRSAYDDDDDGLERPSLHGPGSAIAATTAFKKPLGAASNVKASSRTPRSLPTVEEESLPQNATGEATMEQQP